MTRLRAILVDDETPARERLKRLLRSHPDVECVGEASDGLRALALADETSPDLVFLDIQMPELDGLAVAAALSPSGPAVVFVTAFDDHAIRAFELAAVDYLLKPIVEERLVEALRRVRLRIAAKATVETARPEKALPKPTKMAVRTGSKYVVFDTERISAILAQDHYSAILVDGAEHLSDDPLDKLMERLDETHFVRVHRSAILNLRFVRELTNVGDRKYVAVMEGAPKTKIAISRDKLDDLKARLGIP